MEETKERKERKRKKNGLEKAEGADTLFVGGPRKGFRQNVGRIVGASNIDDLDVILGAFISNVVGRNVYVLGFGYIDWVLGHRDGGLIVGIDGGWTTERATSFSKEMTEPKSFPSSKR